MEQVRNPQNFRFSAIPQVMAVGTLALCYNNPKVFTDTASAPLSGQLLHRCMPSTDSSSPAHCLLAFLEQLCILRTVLHSQDSLED